MRLSTPASTSGSSLTRLLASSILYRAWTPHSKELAESFHSHGLNYSCDLISVRSVPSATEPVNPFYMLQRDNRRQILKVCCRSEVKYRRQRLSVLKNIRESTDNTLKWASDQISVSYIWSEMRGGSCHLEQYNKLAKQLYIYHLHALHLDYQPGLDCPLLFACIPALAQYPLPSSSKSDIKRPIDSSPPKQNASIFICCRYMKIAKLFLKNKVFLLVKQKSLKIKDRIYEKDSVTSISQWYRVQPEKTQSSWACLQICKSRTIPCLHASMPSTSTTSKRGPVSVSRLAWSHYASRSHR